jgi:1,4-alpha-glucan branching enzyme
MLKKTKSKNGKTCRVTFSVPAEVQAHEVVLCGEFNDWSETSHPLTRRKDGRFSTTLTLDTGRDYRFRYLLDGERWENDWEADAYLPNDFGSEDSVARL